MPPTQLLPPAQKGQTCLVATSPETASRHLRDPGSGIRPGCAANSWRLHSPPLGSVNRFSLTSSAAIHFFAFRSEAASWRAGTRFCVGERWSPCCGSFTWVGGLRKVVISDTPAKTSLVCQRVLRRPRFRNGNSSTLCRPKTTSEVGPPPTLAPRRVRLGRAALERSRRDSGN